MEDYELTDTIYNMILKYHKITEKNLTSDEQNFLYEQCEEMDREIFDFITTQKDSLEEWKKDKAYEEEQENTTGETDEN